MRNSNAPDIERQIRKMTKLGLGRIRSIKEVQRTQDDVLKTLSTNYWLRGLYTDLKGCDASACGRVNCAEVCAFGTWRRGLQLGPALYRLIGAIGQPAYEVRVVRGLWARPAGELHDVSIAAAKQLNRRALDSLYVPSLIAVGMVKIHVGPRHLDPHWICELHQIVVGATKQDLEGAFTRSWGREHYDSVVRVQKVKHLGITIGGMLQFGLEGWRHPDAGDAAIPTAKERREFYRWLIGTKPGSRLIRYGCDRYLNPLKKAPRTIRPKVLKPRPYPTWLTPYMFGNREQPLRGFEGNGFGRRRRS